MRSGTWQGVQGNKCVVNTDKGPWSMFPDKSLNLNIPLGQQVQFECEKPPGKNYWRMTHITSANGGPAPVGQAAQSAMPARPTASHRPPTQQRELCPDKDVSMFVMGVIGRCFQGTGAFPGEQPLRQMVAAAARAYREGLADAAGAGPMDDGAPVPAPGDYGNDTPPWDA